MTDLLEFIKNQVLFSKRLAEDKARQEQEGYTVRLISGGSGGQCAEYQEKTRRICVGVSFEWNHQSICVDEIKRWEPIYEKVSPDERRRIVERVASHLSCWGAEVRVVVCYTHESRDLRTLLQDYEIPCAERDGYFVLNPLRN